MLRRAGCERPRATCGVQRPCYLAAAPFALPSTPPCHRHSWGHDFRHAFRRLGALRRELPRTPIMALTATATQRVQVCFCVIGGWHAYPAAYGCDQESHGDSFRRMCGLPCWPIVAPCSASLDRMTSSSSCTCGTPWSCAPPSTGPTSTSQCATWMCRSGRDVQVRAGACWSCVS